MVTLTQAIELINLLIPKKATEVVPLEQSLYRICAKDYFAKFSMPRFDNSAMDGFAVKADDGGKTLSVKAQINAGDSSNVALEHDQAIKIMTGAKLPSGTQAVVPIEDVDYDSAKSLVTLPKTIKNGANIRCSGEDLEQNDRIVAHNTEITAYDIGALSSQGYSYIEVLQPLRASILSSGHELKPHYDKIDDAQLYNSNAPTIEALVKSMGVKVVSSYIEKDSYEALREAICNAQDSDIVFTTGGASVGDKDFTKEVIKDLDAQTVFEKIEIKPGKPTSLYKIDDTYLLVLPGNPLAAMVNFEIVGKSLILQLQNQTSKYLQPINAKLAHDYDVKIKRDTIVLGEFDGEYFTPLALQLPGMVSPLQKANAYVIFAKGALELHKDKQVGVLLLHRSICSQKQNQILTR